jgi:hypothetical protein
LGGQGEQAGNYPKCTSQLCNKHTSSTIVVEFTFVRH